MEAAANSFNIVALEPVAASADELVRVLGRSDQVKVHRPKNAGDAAMLVQQLLPCLLVISYRSADQVNAQVALIKAVDKFIQTGQVKVFVVATEKNQQVSQVFASLGVTNYVEEPITPRALMFKVNFAIKSIRQKAIKTAALSENRTVFKVDQEKAAAKKPAKEEAPVQYKPALQIGQDIFIFTTNRKSGKKYELEAEGPSPLTGEWKKEPKPKGSKEEDKWRWVPKPGAPGSAGLETRQGDGWMAHGEQPTFNPQTNRWKMRSAAPQVYLRKGGEKAAVKVDFSPESGVSVAEASQAARDNIELGRKLAARMLERDPKAAGAKKGEGGEQDDAAGKAKAKLAAGKGADDKASGEEAGSPGAAGTGREMRISESVAPPSTMKEITSGEAVYDGFSDSELDSDANMRDVRGRDTFGRKAGEAEIAGDGLSKGQLASDANRREGMGRGVSGNLGKPEESREGLSGDKLDSDANKRDVRGRDAFGSVGKEDSPDGLSDEQLDAEGNKRDVRREFDRDYEQEEAEATAPEDSPEEPAEEEAAPGFPEEQPWPEGLEPDDPEPEEPPLSEETRDRALDRLDALRDFVKREREQPLPKEISPEKEKALRRALGPKNRAELKGAALAACARSEKLRKAQKEARQIKKYLERRGVPLEDLLSDEEAAELQIQKPERKNRNFRAIDSLEEAEEEESGGGSKRPEWVEAAEKEGTGESPEDRSRLVFTLEVSEVQPEGATWETDGQHWFYLPPDTLTQQRKDPSELLPLWVFDGEDQPELLSDQQCWRFYDIPARHVRAMHELPKAVRELLEGLCEGPAPADAVESQPEGEELSAVQEGPEEGGGTDLVTRDPAAGGEGPSLREKKKGRSSDFSVREPGEAEGPELEAREKARKGQELEAREESARPKAGAKARPAQAEEAARALQGLEGAKLDPKLKGEIEGFLEGEALRDDGAAEELAEVIASEGTLEELFADNPFFLDTRKAELAARFLLADAWVDHRPFEHYAFKIARLGRQVARTEWVSVSAAEGNGGLLLASTYPKHEPGQRISFEGKDVVKRFPCEAGGAALGWLTVHGLDVELTAEQEKLLTALAGWLAAFWGRYGAAAPAVPGKEAA